MLSLAGGAVFLRALNRFPAISRGFCSLSNEYIELIETCGRDRELNFGKLLHARLIINGLARLTHFAAKFIAFYAACGRIKDARILFDKIPQTNPRRWIVLIGAYSRCGYYTEALSVFCELQRGGLRPSEYIIPSVLKACGHLSDNTTGRKLHTLILKYSLESDAYVCSALIDMYAKSGEIEKARRVFESMAGKDLVALNAMVSGYAHHGLAEEALNLVEEMQVLGVKPNLVTWNTLVTGFSQMGEEEMVHELFKEMEANGIQPDVVSWTSVISGFVQNFRNEEAFGTFRRMLNAGFCPTSSTISSLLPACASVGNGRRGKEIHGHSMVLGVEKDVYVRTALVDMYAKCGYFHEARILFWRMSERNSATWNSMIFGYANHGCCNEAIELFHQMKDDDEKKLDHLTFTAVLTACGHAGLVDLGRSLFQLMQSKYGIVPRVEHYACMVDVLGRAGKLAEAYDLIKTMPVEPDLYVWGALLGACRKHGEIELAEEAAKHLSELEPGSVGNSLLLSDLYANAGSWGHVVKLKKMMKKRKLKKFPGCSWIGTA
ncbi:pentatricopeptide repeat-containing protein At5g59600-like [Benincasa hispida]|uniref:pentatricopeptide repeat-containing protein At5g59600-like n=1 Tax=Benincasa hispida TaxID=102211 RepID=UPI001900E16A|nr:pentatricopeptide repeat-containing protein At5g59600-like [Benincasa hispida]